MNSWLPRRLLLTAGSADSVRQQLGLPSGAVPESLDPALLPLTDDVRRQLREWADSFVALHRSGRGDDDAARRWSSQGFAVAAAIAGELDPDVEWRYLVHSAFPPVDGRPVTDPVAGLFRDDLALPELLVRAGWTAYLSTLKLEFGGRAGRRPALPEPWLTAARTDATDDELRELRRRAVDPVVNSLLTPDELTGARVVVYQEDGNREISLWLEARGEDMRQWLWHPEYSGHSPDAVDVAAHLADSMEDWVCETVFAWGQRRTAVYEVPPPR